MDPLGEPRTRVVEKRFSFLFTIESAPLTAMVLAIDSPFWRVDGTWDLFNMLPRTAIQQNVASTSFYSIDGVGACTLSRRYPEKR